MIKISKLKKKFGNLEVLKNINLTIEDGDIYGLVGRSGAGKSTLLRCINGLTDYQEGSFELLPSEWTSEINKFTLNLEGSNFYA